jgi:excisionase family DNA binding protein
MLGLLEDKKSVLVTPDEEIVRSAERLRVALQDIRQRRGQVVLTDEADDVEPIVLPDSIVELLARLCAQLSQGEALLLSPAQKQLTTYQAAKFLGVSRQYLCRLLDQGRLSYTRVGTHRRISLIDLLRYREEHHRARQQSLDELTRLTVDSGLEYFGEELRG